MVLDIKERILLLSLLPKETNFATMKIIRDLENNLGLNEDEIKECKVTITDKNIQWEHNTEKNISIGEKATDIIKSALKKLDDESKLTKDHFSLCEKFL